MEGRQAYPQAQELLVLADGGGSNGHRSRLFKSSLQQFANDSGLAVTVCHYPTGASKWNPVEHSLFSQISINWAAQPLRSLDTMLGIHSRHHHSNRPICAGLAEHEDLSHQSQGFQCADEVFEPATFVNVPRLELHHPPLPHRQRALISHKMRSYSCTAANWRVG